MGKAGSKMWFWTRPFKYFNIEQRAFKEISKEKQKPAPSYPVMQNVMDQIKKDPNLLTKGSPSKETLDNLQKVYLTSKGDNPIIRAKHSKEQASFTNPSIPPSKSSSKLPKSTEEVKDPYYGFEEPYIIPKGKVSLRQALDLIGKYQDDSEKWSIEVLSKEFKLDVTTTSNIVQHFHAFQVHVPRAIGDKKNVGRIEQAKNFVTQQFLPSGKKEKEKES